MAPVEIKLNIDQTFSNGQEGFQRANASCIAQRLIHNIAARCYRNYPPQSQNPGTILVEVSCSVALSLENGQHNLPEHNVNLNILHDISENKKDSVSNSSSIDGSQHGMSGSRAPRRTYAVPVEFTNTCARSRRISTHVCTGCR